MKAILRIVVRAILPLIVLIAAGGIARMLIANAPRPEPTTPTNEGTLVMVTVVSAGEHQVSVLSQGQVRAARTVQVQSQVSGLVEWIHPALVEGGLLQEGE